MARQKQGCRPSRSLFGTNHPNFCWELTNTLLRLISGVLAVSLQGNQTDISQLDTIFSVFGTPTETNWPDHSSLPLCTRGLEWDSSPSIPFDEIFTAASADALSLLRSMLVLDPNKRFTAEQCLSHPYFLNDPSPTPKEKLILSSD